MRSEYQMKQVTLKELISMRVDNVAKAVKRWLLDRQIASLDKSIDVINRSIKNEQGALRVLQKDRMLVNNRRNSLR